MKVLSIGNSFSVDSQRFVPQIAKAGGVQIELGNLYIGGCSLETHVNNIHSGLPAYEYYINNEGVGYASIQTGLHDNDWDIITLQQASHLSGIEDSYYPYLTELADYVRKEVPKARLYIHQTWAYEYNSTHGGFVNYNNNRFEMHERLTKAYIRAAKTIGADIIPVGNAISAARALPEFDPEKGGTQLSRDGFHLSWRLGRYIASAVWYEVLTGKDIRDNGFVPMSYEYLGKDASGEIITRPIPGTEPDAKLFALAREILHESVAASSNMLDSAK